MTTSRITWKISDFNGRFRAQMFVDGLPQQKAYFDTLAEAEQWCIAQAGELRREVREYR